MRFVPNAYLASLSLLMMLLLSWCMLMLSLSVQNAHLVHQVNHQSELEIAMYSHVHHYLRQHPCGHKPTYEIHQKGFHLVIQPEQYYLKVYLNERLYTMAYEGIHLLKVS